MTIPYSAGSLYSTTHDLLKWEQGLFGGKVLKPESLKKMTTPFLNDYAFGLGVRTTNGRTEIAHSGGINGFNTSMRYWPDEKLTVIALANLNGLAPDLITAAAAKVIHGEKVILPSERKQVSVSPDVLKQYVGTYELTSSLSLSITLEGEQLMAQLANQPKTAIFPESATSFFAKDTDAQIEFMKATKK
jgi:CubicO group peptidase (beta-lactamase class C family)